MASRAEILSIYKSLLRESGKFASYNFRSYALRRVRDAFKANKNITEETEIKNQMLFAKENLNIVKRQATLSDMYRTEKLVIENK